MVVDATLTWTLPLALLLAWCWDAVLGEPPNALHPVAWLGQLLGPVGRFLLQLQPLAACVAGTLAWCLGAALCVAAAWQWQAWALGVPLWLGAPALALAIKPTLSWRMLRDEVAGVETALLNSPGNLQPARGCMARLCSRDVSQLDADQLRETALETLSENLNDSVLAPLIWLLVAGLPGAVLYRYANTADAMWGYRGRWEWAGKWAARADDVLSWLPARCAGLALAPWRCWPQLPAQARQTPSPNGGWPMGALALRLGVRLRKPGVYNLNAAARSPVAADMRAALRCTAAVAWWAAAITAVGLTALVFWRG